MSLPVGACVHHDLSSVMYSSLDMREACVSDNQSEEAIALAAEPSVFRQASNASNLLFEPVPYFTARSPSKYRLPVLLQNIAQTHSFFLAGIRG